MSKKKNKKVAEGGEKKENNDHKEEKEQKQGGGGGDGGKKEGSGNTVLFKLDLHCEGCASKVVKFVKGFEGVESVKPDGASGKLAVTGKVDPVKLWEKLEQKTHKKVELLTPVPKKDKESNKSKDDSGDGKEEKNKEKDNKPKEKNSKDNKKNKQEEKNAKEPPVTSASLKVPLHCEGCINKITKIVSKTKGYEEMKLDKPNDLVMVKGAMDMKALAETLRKQLKKDVEIVQPKKDEKKEKGKGGGQGKAVANDGGGEGSGEMMEGNKMQVQFNHGYGYPSPYVYSPSPYVYGPGPYAYGPSPYVYGPSYVVGGGDPYYQFSNHAPQMFSDENPNACSIM